MCQHNRCGTRGSDLTKCIYMYFGALQLQNHVLLYIRELPVVFAPTENVWRRNMNMAKGR